MNRKGESRGLLVIIGVAVLLIFAYRGGYLDGFLPSNDAGTGAVNEPNAGTTENCPTTGITTYTLNVQDELASTATNVDAEYYIFNGNKFIKEGATGADGTVDVDVTCGKDYQLLLTNTTATAGTGLYSKVIPLNARTSADTINAQLIYFGDGKILGIENPADPSGIANVSLAAGGTGFFNIKFVANGTRQGYNKPIIMCEALISNISKITADKFSDGTSVNQVTALPKRITASAGQQYYAWEYPKMLTPDMGVISLSGAIESVTTAAPDTTQDMSCKMIDQAPWKKSNYKTATSIEDAFPVGPENTETITDVGGPDSAVSSFTFVNANGY